MLHPFLWSLQPPLLQLLILRHATCHVPLWDSTSSHMVPMAYLLQVACWVAPCWMLQLLLLLPTAALLPLTSTLTWNIVFVIYEHTYEMLIISKLFYLCHHSSQVTVFCLPFSWGCWGWSQGWNWGWNLKLFLNLLCHFFCFIVFFSCPHPLLWLSVLFISFVLLKESSSLLSRL
jgi:hypothetical protein